MHSLNNNFLLVHLKKGRSLAHWKGPKICSESDTSKTLAPHCPLHCKPQLFSYIDSYFSSQHMFFWLESNSAGSTLLLSGLSAALLVVQQSHSCFESCSSGSTAALLVATLFQQLLSWLDSPSPSSTASLLLLMLLF